MEKRLIDINPIIGDLTAMKSMYDAILLNAMIKALENAPTVDAVEVVRCKDCRYFATEGYDTAGEEDLQIGYCARLVMDVQACQFCSCGERRSDNAAD